MSIRHTILFLLTLTLLPSAWGAIMIGETKYDDLDEAFTKAVDGEVLVVTESQTYDPKGAWMTLSDDKAITLDLAGCTLNDNKSTSSAYVISISKGKLTIKDSVGGGALQQTGSSGRYAIYMTGGELVLEAGVIEAKCPIYVAGAAKVTINGGTLSASGVSSGYCAGVYLYSGASSLTVNGGAFSGSKYNIQSKTTSAIAITGGTFANATVCSITNASTTATLSISGGKFSCADAASILYSASGYSITGGLFSQNVTGELADNPDPDTQKQYPYWYETVAEDPVFSVTGSDGKVRKYATLKILNANIADGDEITLLEDIDEEDDLEVTSSAKVTLDLAGHTFTASDSVINLRNADAELTVKDSVGNGQLASGSLNAVVIVVGGTFNLESGIVTNTANHTGIWANGNDTLAGTVNVKGGSVYGKVAINQAYQGTKVNVSGGTITGTTAVEIKSGDSFTMSGGTLNCARGLDFLNGYTTPTAQLTGGTINATESCIYAQYATQEIRVDGATLNAGSGTAIIVGNATPVFTIYSGFVKAGTICDQETTVLKKYICGGYFSVKPKTSQIAANYASVSSGEYEGYPYHVIPKDTKVTVDTVSVPVVWLDEYNSQFPEAKGNVSSVAAIKVGKNKALSVAECYALGIEPNDDAEFTINIEMNGNVPVVTTVPASARENVATIVRKGNTGLTSEGWVELDDTSDLSQYNFFKAEVKLQ